jgi:hypothetical protein
MTTALTQAYGKGIVCAPPADAGTPAGDLTQDRGYRSHARHLSSTYPYIFRASRAPMRPIEAI